MNRHEKKIVKFTNKIIKNSTFGNEFNKFRFVRQYVRVLMSHDHKRHLEFTNKYIKNLK